MEQVSKKARRNGIADMADIPSRVQITGTRRYVRIGGIKPYTLERLTRLWMKREDVAPSDSADVLKSMCREPYFSIKEAVILSINNVFGLLFWYPIKWRIWAYWHEYTEEQMTPIIQEGKKKLPLTPHWMNMVFSVDMRMDWQKMTSKEAEQYRAELLWAMKQHSSKNSQSTEGGNGVSEATITGAN